MAYPLIIIGAGASHGYADHPQGHTAPIPPLTNDLVDPKRLNEKIARQYPGVADLLSEISGMVTHEVSGVSFESALSKIIDATHKTKENELLKQLVALQFYLRDFFEIVSDNFYEHNRYRSLFSRLSRSSAQKALIVSFNYDSLLEKSITSQKFQKLNDYISGPIKVIKPHGSHDWSYVRSKEFYKSQAFKYLSDNPEKIKGFSGNDIYHTDQLKGENNIIKFPVIQNPIQNKDNFICPHNHIRLLETELASIDRILIVGWRAADKELLKIMQKNILNEVSVSIAVGDKEETEKIMTTMERATYNFSGYSGKFNDFIASEEFNKFFL